MSIYNIHVQYIYSLPSQVVDLSRTKCSCAAARSPCGGPATVQSRKQRPTLRLPGMEISPWCWWYGGLTKLCLDVIFLG